MPLSIWYYTTIQQKVYVVAPVIIYKLLSSLLGREGNPSSYLCQLLNLFKTQALYLCLKVFTYISPVRLWKACKFMLATVMPWKCEWCGCLEYNGDQRFHVLPEASNCNNFWFQTIYTWRDLGLNKEKRNFIWVSNKFLNHFEEIKQQK